MIMVDHNRRITENRKFGNRIMNICFACGITWTWPIFFVVMIVLFFKDRI